MKVWLYKANRLVLKGKVDRFVMLGTGLSVILDDCYDIWDKNGAIVETVADKIRCTIHLEYSHQIRPQPASYGENPDSVQPTFFIEEPENIKRLTAKVAELRQILDDFPGHISESEWNNWMFRRVKALMPDMQVAPHPLVGPPE